MHKKISLGAMSAKIDFEDAALLRIASALDAGAKVGIACSGGADSVFLLMSLLDIFKGCEKNFVVLHFNHKVRANAEIDEVYVRDLTDKLKISSHFGFAQAVPPKVSEGNLRELRLNFFSDCAKKLHLDCIAQGHHAGDVAETLLMRLMRGAGLDGLAAPRAVSEIGGACFVRPLLNTSKAKIVDILRGAKIEWREDESNAECDFLRNKVRNNLIGEIEKISPWNFVDSATRTRALLCEDADFINQVFENELSKASESSYGESDDSGSVLKLGDALIKNRALLRRAIFKLLSKNGLLEKFRASAIDAFVDKILSGAASARASVGSKFLRFDLREKTLFLDTQVRPFRMNLKIGKNVLPDGSILSVKKIRLPAEKKAAIMRGENDDKLSAYLDLSAVKEFNSNAFLARTKEDGDAYAPIGSKSRKAMKELFNAKKIPLMKRKSAVIVCNERGEILWTAGLAPCAKYALKPDGLAAIELTFSSADF